MERDKHSLRGQQRIEGEDEISSASSAFQTIDLIVGLKGIVKHYKFLERVKSVSKAYVQDLRLDLIDKWLWTGDMPN